MAEPIAYTVQELKYAERDGVALSATVYRPEEEGVYPLIVAAHGGAWCYGGRGDNPVVNKALAASGIVVASVDFRMPPVASYPGSIADINFAIRWFKARAGEFCSVPDQVGVMGVSSGGHQAMLVAMRPRDPCYRDAPDDPETDVTAAVAFVVLCAPVIDPLGRYEFAKSLPVSHPDREILVSAHDRYWLTEDAMAEGSPLRILERHEAVECPRVLYIQGVLDTAHPRQHLDRFVAEYRNAGGTIDLHLLEGASRVFEGEDPDSGVTAAAIHLIADFVKANPPLARAAT